MLLVSRFFLVMRAFYIVGPTASGKSEIGAEIAAACRGEVVSADAFQIYRGLPLLTAQPSESLLRKAPHHLIGQLPLNQEMNAEKFRLMATGAITEINGRGKLAIVVGGSGLYLKALTHGLAPLPATDPELRAQLNLLPMEELVSRLLQADPAAGKKTDLRNKRRVIRALEIFLQTKTPASKQRAEWGSKTNRLDGVFVYRERADLYARIDRRVEQMFSQGVTAEVALANEAGGTASKTLGLHQIRQHLNGQISRAECMTLIQQSTRRYAKRQLTWFRGQTNFVPLNLSLLKDNSAAVAWILQKLALLPPFE